MRLSKHPFLVFGVVAFAALWFTIWATDFVTRDSEWTIYTARCDGGAWTGDVCGGTMKAGDRHRFRALKAHREVLYWTAGETGESGRYLKCQIRDGRNWICPGDRQGPPAIATKMVHGIPDETPSAEAAAVHRIPKWKWELLSHGLPAGRTASN